MRFAFRWFAGAAASLGTVPVALAQSAKIEVFHNDFDGIIVPGQTVRIDYFLTWQGMPSLATMKGDAVATPNRGLAMNPVIGFANGTAFPPSIQPGVPDGGSIRGFNAQHFTISGFVLPGFTWTPLGVTALSYEWVAPGPEHTGSYDFTFQFDAQWPSIALFPGVQTGFEFVPTTVVPMTLTVTPGPASLTAILAATVLSRRRRLSR